MFKTVLICTRTANGIGLCFFAVGIVLPTAYYSSEIIRRVNRGEFKTLTVNCLCGGGRLTSAAFVMISENVEKLCCIVKTVAASVNGSCFLVGCGCYLCFVGNLFLFR